MCGIIGYVGHQQAAPILLDGLARMEYRGYDSAGVAVRSETKGLQVYKSKGRLQVLSDMIHGGADVEGTLGIGHTRWATHGEPNDTNAHPHASQSGDLAIVHNGTIENYTVVKKALEQHGYAFRSETDTEVVVQLIDYIRTDTGCTLFEAVREACHQIVGAYAIAVIARRNPNQIVVARKSSPLVIGVGDGEYFIASDATPIVEYTNRVVYLNDDEIAVDSNFAAQSFWKDAILRFFGKRSAVLGLILIVVIVLLAVFGPGMNSYTYSGQDLSQKNFAPRVPGIEQFGILDGSEKMSTTTGTKIVNNYVEKGKDDVYYWFGSDLYGRDIWTRTWEGARVSLIIAVAAAVIDMVIGMSYGLISGYFGGKVDMLMQRFLEVANGIPRLVIVTLLLLVLQPGMITIIFALMLTEWVGMSRIARAEMLKLKDQEFVLASRTLGAGSFFIIFKEVLPNIIGPIITQVMFSIPTAIFTEAFLSFVGLGIPVPQCSLGSLISELYNSFTTHPYQIIPPIVVMSLLMLSFNLLADGLREALDPKMKSM